MSELTFREQAALALCASSTIIVSLEEIIETSQKLADAACKMWGHQGPKSPAVVCPRCGNPTSVEPEPQEMGLYQALKALLESVSYDRCSMYGQSPEALAAKAALARRSR